MRLDKLHIGTRKHYVRATNVTSRSWRLIGVSPSSSLLVAILSITSLILLLALVAFLSLLLASSLARSPSWCPVLQCKQFLAKLESQRLTLLHWAVRCNLGVPTMATVCLGSHQKMVLASSEVLVSGERCTEKSMRREAVAAGPDRHCTRDRGTSAAI
jgi:hypothetical protein